MNYIIILSKQVKEQLNRYLINLKLKLKLYSWKERSIKLVDLYTALIINGRRTFAQVPKSLQPAVHETLLSLGLGDDGKPIA